MAKFNIFRARPAGTSPVATAPAPSGRTYEGGDGYARDTKSELFLLAVSNLGGEHTFYESGNQRDTRFAQLVHEAALADPEWTARLLKWLRSEANMRTASLVGAAEFVYARLVAETDAGVTNRAVVDSVLQRADEPGELLAYWTSVNGRRVPKPVKRGIADAVRRLYDERAVLKWDSDARGFRMADVLNLAHPSPAADWQGSLFQYVLDRRRDGDVEVPSPLRVIAARRELMAWPVEQRRELFTRPDAADVLRRAGMTWESVAGWLQGPMTKEVWEALAPSMGYMALLRNLRNFDEAGMSDEAAAAIAARLADPGQVARSRQFPFRFLSAYEAAPSLRWGHALDQALQASLGNLPALPGRSLILVDTSASMTGCGFSARSKVTPAKAAAVFGVALGAKGEQVDVVGFADGTFRHDVKPGASVIRTVDGFLKRIGEVGHGTDIVGSLQRTYRGHDRVFIISDMQTIAGPYGTGVADVVPRHVPVYGFNLGGYQQAAFATGKANRHEFGGLTDATFRMIPLLEAGRNADWPF
ncbi:TROVE domain-containing protein [Lentzea flava]|uniref:RNA-binding protein n=1 Tax=Lentzea flava TaxID=103732 RepID=A0ABQ2V0R0_9PSEU|nr:TROVE domain-containing protein [Lentzea flava]MCP2202905.1 TROVE domain-containing protein [Lentzea flava]GGU63016.1 RNA-binding protein [Lentzea flava]